MTLNKWYAGALVVVALFALYGALKSPGTNTIETIKETLGASPGPDRFNQCESVNGIRTCYNKMTLLQATSTPCSIKSPEATSTLVRGTVRFNIASSAAMVVTMARSANPSATTTSLGSATVGASATGLLNASTTLIGGSLDTPYMFAPNTYFTAAMAGGSGGYASNVPTGLCQATFEVIQ